MTGIFNDPLYGKRNRIVALVLLALLLLAGIVVWIFTSFVIFLGWTIIGLMTGTGAMLYYWPGRTWPATQLHRQMLDRELEMRTRREQRRRR